MTVVVRFCISLTVLLLGACQEVPQQTVLRFSAAPELDVPAGSTLRLEVWNADLRQHEEGRILGPEPFVPDSQLVIDARGGDISRRFTVFAELLDPAGARISWARVRTGFVEDQLSEVRVMFAPACPHPPDRMDHPGDFDELNTCGSHDTCVVVAGVAQCSPACAAAEVFAESLRDTATPQVMCPAEDCMSVEEVQSAETSSCALAGGEVFCWGQSVTEGPALPVFSQPSRIFDENRRALPGSPIEHLSVYNRHVCVLDADGRIRCGGANPIGHLGVLEPESSVCCTIQPPAPAFSRIGTGGGWIAGIAQDDGALWYSGSHPVGGQTPGPPLRVLPDTIGLTDFVSGRHFVAAFVGGILTWQGALAADSQPALREDEVEVYAAQFTLCAVDDEGGMRCWGQDVMRNNYAAQPAEVPGRWRNISLSKSEVFRTSFHRCAVREDGTLHCWGSNGQGQLGRAEPESVDVSGMLQVGERSDWASVSVGGEHTCAVDEQGRLYCWGANLQRQLGEVRASGPEPGFVCLPAW